MPSILKTKHLTKCYGPLVAVSGLSLEVGSGEVFGLLGPNGAGKSTTLGMLCGLIPPTSGSILLFGKSLQKHRLAALRCMGVVMERPAFWPHLSALKTLKILARMAAAETNIDRTLDRVGLLHAARRRVGDFSTGMLQRLALAQALLTEPELLILDEPTNGLDAESAIEVLNLLRHLADNARVSILFSSHQLHEVETLCDRVAILNKGRLVSCDRTDALLSYDQTQVEVLTDSPESAARRLAQEDWIVSAHAAKGKVDVVLREPDVHRLTALLLHAGYMVSGIIPRRRSLHDYFLKVVNR